MIIIGRIILFLLPLLAFYLWYRTMQKIKNSEGEIDPKDEHLLRVYSGAGIAAIILSLVVIVVTREQSTEGEYIAPKMIDGKIKPGEVSKSKH